MKTIKSILKTKFSVGIIILFVILAVLGDYIGRKAYNAYEEYAKTQILEVLEQPNVCAVKFKGFSVKEITYVSDGETKLITIDKDGNILKEVDF